MNNEKKVSSITYQIVLSQKFQLTYEKTYPPTKGVSTSAHHLCPFCHAAVGLHKI